MSSEQYLFLLAEDIQKLQSEIGFAALSARERVFFCVWSLEAEINNGGFEQFFFNSAGDLAVAVAAALRSIGAEHTASIVDRAVAVFGPGPSQDQETRRQQLESLAEERLEVLATLDQAFLEYRDNLSDLLARFMRSTACESF